MNCRKCGKKIEGSRLFCPSCGTEQMVPEYNKIEDELVESMEKIKKDTRNTNRTADSKRDTLTGRDALKIPSLTRRESAAQSMKNPRKNLYEEELSQESEENTYDDEYDEIEWEEEEFHLEKRDTAKQRRVKLIASITALSLTIVVIIAIIIVLAVRSLGHSAYDKQIANGEESWKKGDYEAAIPFFENAVEKAGDNIQKVEALTRLAELYIEYGDNNSAIYYYESAVEAGRISDEDLSTLVNLYESKADLNAIRRLAETYSNKENESLFEKHLLNQPVFNYKSGTYNELLTVDITAANNEQIFYTLDNSEATPQSTPYTEPLQIGEGTTIVRAIALNANGLISDEIITTYEVSLDTPPTPIITPETGSYADTSKITLRNIPTNCKAYYTIDGTVPTAESMEYTGPFDMMLGNYVVMAVCINQYSGQSSPVAMKIYDLSIGGKISYAESPGRVMTRLQEMGEVLDSEGTMADGEKCILLPATVTKIGNTNYYIVKRYQTTSAGMKEQGSAYAVDINTGAAFRAEDNGAGQYNLSGL
ncbi:MAG: hypothetical protein HFI75_14370 [Lachnospiraceae bacterium]|nr:hypothetical protein [Lachnospiraceae bacterium]